jgi:hypothetical protein
MPETGVETGLTVIGIGFNIIPLLSLISMLMAFFYAGGIQFRIIKRVPDKNGVRQIVEKRKNKFRFFSVILTFLSLAIISLMNSQFKQGRDIFMSSPIFMPIFIIEFVISGLLMVTLILLEITYVTKEKE